MFSAMLASTTDFTYIFDLDGRFLFANKALLDLWGIPLSAAEGKNFFDLGYPPELAETLQLQVQQVIATGRNVIGETPYVNSKGHHGIYEYIFSPVVAADGRVELVAGTARDITERRRFTDELVASAAQQLDLSRQLEVEHSRLLAAQRVAKVGSWQTDLTTMSVMWSDETHRIHETDAATFHPEHQDHIGLCHPDDRLRVQEAFAQSLAQCGVDHVLGHRISLAGGRIKFIEKHWQVVPDSHGKASLAIGTCQDVTARELAENALRESEAEMRTLAESVPHIVWSTGTDGRSSYFSQRWMEYTGLTLAESLGHGWTKAFHPEDLVEARAALRCATQPLRTYVLEARLRRFDGEYRWWLLRGVPQCDLAGNLVKWFGTCTDIDEIKRSQLDRARSNRELQRQRTELRVLFDLMPAMVWFKDINNTIVRVNQRAAETAGLPVSDIEGRPWAEAYPDDAKFHAADLEVIHAGIPKLGVLEMIRDSQGAELWVQTDKVPYRDEAGNVIGIVVMSQDVTERKRDQDSLRELNVNLEVLVNRRTTELNSAREEAERANRAKSDFLAAMSHEIRTPMGGLLGLLEMLELSSMDEDQHTTLAVARESGSALLRIMDDILDFSKIEANFVELNLVAGSVRNLVERTCGLHNEIAFSKGLALNVEIAEDLSPLLSFDPLRLGQILNNFLNNAIKFTQEGAVDVRVESLGRSQGMEQLRLSVRDTGIGMSQLQLSRLFQPFVQASADTSARFGGTGLGLVISRRLAELMGGTVIVDSREGTGTTFTVELALEVCDAQASPRHSDTARVVLEALLAGRRAAPTVAAAVADRSLLLVVDDHPTNRMVLLRQLASLGYAAESASDGVEALEMWKSGRFAAVITDCNMPRMNGYELTLAMRDIERSRSLRRLPIIACTANALPSAIKLCHEAGMDDCLVKPADLVEVSRKLDRWLPLARIAPADAPRAGPAVQDPTPKSTPQRLLDLDLLAEITGGDVTMQAEILVDFCRANELDAAALRQAAAMTTDFALVVAHAHRIKGACLMLGARGLAAVCGRIEAAGAAENMEAVSTAVAAFEVGWAELVGYIAALPSIKHTVRD